MKIPAILAALKREKKSHEENMERCVEAIKRGGAFVINANSVMHSHGKLLEVNRQIECVQTALVQVKNGIMEESI